jgi:hypothetical protein
MEVTITFQKNEKVLLNKKHKSKIFHMNAIELRGFLPERVNSEHLKTKDSKTQASLGPYLLSSCPQAHLMLHRHYHGILRGATM